ncbi:MAG: N-acetylmuramoyl-L-alanine amidase [Flavobacterium sp.]|nr:N-acetylmuramoyl-L-alanine amidase [Flavobacterium sp.]
MKFYFRNISYLIYVLLFVTTFVHAQTKFKVTLDAGHGGKDVGAHYHGFQEKDITLAIVLKLGKLLEKQQSIDVNYTRKTDVLIDLVERGYIANRAKANIFVSLHCNANKNLAASGTQTFVMGLKKNTLSLDVSRRENEVITLEKDYQKKYNGFDPNKPESYIGQTLMQEEFLDNSISLASKIQEKFVNNLGKKNRGVSQDVFMVLHRATMPRVLVEMGFISNEEEGTILNSELGQDDIAQAIADAILSYKKEYFGDGDDNNDKDEYVRPTPKDNQKLKKEVIETNATTITTYRIQIAVSAKKIKLLPKNFKGLQNVTMDDDNKNYKYFFGNTLNFDEIKLQLKEAKAKGYPSAFISTFKNGKKIN